MAAGEPEPEAVPPVAASPAAPVEPVPAPLSASALAVEQRLREAGFEPPLDSELDGADLTALREAGRAVRVTSSLHYHPEAVEAVRRIVVQIAQEGDGSVTIAQLRDRLGTSRKFAQALLEHLDAERVTIRRGDQHFVRRQAGGSGLRLA